MRLHVRRYPDVVEEPDEQAVVEPDVLATFEGAFGHAPMAHQAEYLGETRNLVVLKGRQVGMTEAAGALAIHTARVVAGSLSALIAPSQRQSSAAAMRARLGLMALGEDLVQDSASVLRLRNGSQILSLPGTDRSVRGYPLDLVVLDEAAWISDLTWNAARATVAATGGRVVAQSTPGEPMGWYHALAADPPPGWASMVVRSTDVPTIDLAFLERERAEMDEATFAQEYLAEWPDPAASARGLFTREQIEAMRSDEPPYEPLRAIVAALEGEET
jgi:hypothetical protein